MGKKKKRTKHTDLVITVSGKPGLSDVDIQRLMDLETGMQVEMQDIIETDEKRNDLESYIFNLRDKISDGSEYGEFISAGDREKFTGELQKAEDWLYDNMEATKAQYVEKLNEHTATALAYGIYRSNDFDAENPCTVAFCSVGHSLFSVAIVQFFKGKLTVLCE